MFNGDSLWVSVFICTFAAMTVTALFRDFLVQHKAKQNYERAFIYVCGVEPQVEKPIDWRDDRLFKVISERMTGVLGVLHDHTQLVYALIGISASSEVMYWQETEDGYDYWYDLALKWMDYYNKNKHKISTSDDRKRY